MADTFIPHFTQNIFTRQETRTKQEKNNAQVGQDKSGLSSDRTASEEPYRAMDEVRADTPKTICDCSEIALTHTKPLVPLTFWVQPEVKEETQHRAKGQGLTASHFGRHVYERGLQGQIDMHYGALLRPTISMELQKGMAAHCRRIAALALEARTEAIRACVYSEVILNLLLKDDPKLFEEYKQAVADETDAILASRQKVGKEGAK